MPSPPHSPQASSTNVPPHSPEQSTTAEPPHSSAQSNEAQLPSSNVASASKLQASGSVQPETGGAPPTVSVKS